MGYTVPGRVSTFWGTLEKQCLLLRVQFTEGQLRAEHAPSSVAVVLIVVIRTWIDVRTIQVQIVRIVSIVRRGGPIVAVATPIVS